MRTNNLICYFPTTVMLIDDQVSFLESISLTLDNRLAYYLYNRPSEALQHISNRKNEISFLNQCLKYNDDYVNNMEININDIYKKIFDPDRFSPISVAVVDYAMPSMDGLEFCQCIKNTSIKKIMLTGEADECLAVRAFNEGIIDKFILKSSANIFENLNIAIRELQIQYFQDLATAVFDGLISNPTKKYICLQDRKFMNFFDSFCNEHNVAEFYLVDGSGSFLLVDYDGKYSLFITKTKKDIDMYYEAAKEDNAKFNVLDELNSFRKIPYFGMDKNFWDIPGDDWEKYLHTAKIITGNEDYYYAVVHPGADGELNDNKIISYNKYLAQVIESTIRKSQLH